MRVPISEAILLVISGILGIIVISYVWEKVVNFIFDRLAKWFYNGKE